MKSFESSVGLTYVQAIAKCQDMGADIAQPMNEVDLLTLSGVLSNFSTTLSSTSYWIGNKSMTGSN